MLSTTPTYRWAIRRDANCVDDGDVSSQLDRGGRAAEWWMAMDDGCRAAGYREAYRSMTCFETRAFDNCSRRPISATTFNRAFSLNTTIIESAKVTVTEAGMAIAMARTGPRRDSSEFRCRWQAAQVAQVRSTNRNGGQSPDHRTQAIAVGRAGADKDQGFSGITVVNGRQAKACRADGRHPHQPRRAVSPPIRRQKISELMTHESLVDVREGVRPGRSEADAAQARIEKRWVDDQYRLRRVDHVKEWNKAVAHPLAWQDAQGRSVAAAIRRRGWSRAYERLMTPASTDRGRYPHGHSSRRAGAKLQPHQADSNAVAGHRRQQLATKEGHRRLIDAGRTRSR